MSSTYVPGYGYVDSSGPGTRGTLKKDKSKFNPVLPSSTDANPGSPGNRRVRDDLTLPISYRPPVFGSADRQEQQIGTLPLVYRIQNAGDLRNAYWGDPESREIIQAAARVYYRDYPNYSDQWAENFWQKDIMGAAGTPGSAPPWQMLQQIFTGQVKAEDDAPTSRSYVSGGGGGGYSAGGGGGTSQRIDLASPSQAQALLTQFMQASVGRNPKSNEVKKFFELLQGYQTNNPTIASASGNTVTQSGGIDPGIVAQEFVETLPDYTESQADRYYRTFMSALLGGA